ncbi:MAG: DUF6754 domain-containing protein [bacterium]
MRTNPRIFDLRWPFISVLVFLVLLAPCVFAQEPGGGEGNQTPGVTAGGDSGGQATQESPASGEPSVVGGEINPSENVPVQPVEEIQPEYNYQFDLPESFKAVDRGNDEGGAIALAWPSSASDETSMEFFFNHDSPADLPDYRGLTKTSSDAPEQDEFATVSIVSGEVLIGAYATTMPDPERTGMYNSEWTFQTYGYVDKLDGSTQFVFRVFKRDKIGNEVELFNVASSEVNLTTTAIYETSFTVPAPIAIIPTDWIVVKVFGKSDSSDTKLHFVYGSSGHKSQVEITMSDYEYWAFQSETGESGTWEQFDGFPTNSQYTWEQPQVFGFFLSEKNKGKIEHYSVYENSFPANGIYQFSINSDETEPQKLTIEANAYNERIKDYASVKVYCDLRPFGGEKVQLEYVPPEDGQDQKPWDNVFRLIYDLGVDKLQELSITKPYFILLTADTGLAGVSLKKAVITVQPTEISEIKPEGVVKNTIINGSEGERPVPDNQYEHSFRVFTVPAGYTLPEGQELPPSAWEIGSMAGPITAQQNWWNGSRTNSWLWGILICLAVMIYIMQARKGVGLFIRRIAGLDHVEEAIGRATEMGRPVLYVNGLGYMSDIATIASVNILGRVARKVADYESRLLVPNRDPIVMAVCQEVIQEAYIDAGRPDSYNKDDTFFLTDDQFAYTAAVNGIMVREKPATNFFMGMFYAESLLLAETGSSTGAIQIAGTDALAQLPFFITTCDYTLIGEELYAASAYLSREPLLLGSLKGQDTAKLMFMIFTFLGTLLVCLTFFKFNIEFIKQLFQAF